MVGSVFFAGHLALCRLSVKSLTFYKELDPIAYGLLAPTAPDASSDKLSVIALSWSAPTQLGRPLLSIPCCQETINPKYEHHL